MRNYIFTGQGLVVSIWPKSVAALPDGPVSRAACLALASVRQATYTLWPSFDSFLAASRPMPLLAPIQHTSQGPSQAGPGSEPPSYKSLFLCPLATGGRIDGVALTGDDDGLGDLGSSLGLHLRHVRGRAAEPQSRHGSKGLDGEKQLSSHHSVGLEHTDSKQ